MPSPGDRCPCRSGEVFGACCGPLLDGRAAAPTAVQLMRSRFTAYAVGADAYLLESWHPSTRPASLELDPGTTWRSLEIVATEAGGPFDTTGVVEFIARYRDADGAGRLHERSRFVREAGRWRYVDAAG
ncbi:hypothetical protein GE115_18145 [Agromyces sp. CFH 90414]|uniref:UPF0225 protein GE115_18145 n=1 Tax=Agromyces agglutinans TaxID=2662258 RepID=A0A6I2FBP4_9MICO|nr:hypothetical protein [Agromyces agglutinans]